MTIDAKGLREKAVRLWNTSYGDYTDKEPEPCGCHADPEHGPHHQDGTRIVECLALPADLGEAVLACVEAARTAVYESGLCGSLDALEAALARLDAAGGRGYA